MFPPTTSLGLGTVQFGTDYGITNASGRVPEAEVEAILAAARNGGIDLIDTAPVYGDSEPLLGRCGVTDFRIVTKTPRFSGEATGKVAADELTTSFAASLNHLGVARTYGLLAHHAPDLLAPGGDSLMAAMRDLRRMGLVERIGASIYYGTEIDDLLDSYDDIDLVQLPINVLDRRLVSGGQIRRLAERGIEIHARSVFLQGLLLAPSHDLPLGLSGLAPFLHRWHTSVKARGLTPLEGALGFLKTVPEISTVVVGVIGHHHLMEVLATFATAPTFPAEGLACENPKLVDPTQWNLLASPHLRKNSINAPTD